MTNICYSGGADGADSLWGGLATLLDHTVMHFSFHGHKTSADRSQIIMLTESDLSLSALPMTNVSKVINRNYPPSSKYVRNLIDRNYYQVAISERVYAIGSLDSNNIVKGGTAWAVHCFIEQNNNPEVYLLDKQTLHWWVYENSKWVLKPESYLPPQPNGQWAGIGSRNISSDVIDYIFNSFLLNQNT